MPVLDSGGTHVSDSRHGAPAGGRRKHRGPGPAVPVLDYFFVFGMRPLRNGAVELMVICTALLPTPTIPFGFGEYW